MTSTSHALASELASLADAVQHNCNIADAHHAQDYPLCIYLLKMREYYRWAHGLPFHASLNKQKLGQWISQRESLWQDLEGRPFRKLPIAGEVFDPYDLVGVNRALVGKGLLYGAGFGLAGRAHFFLARLHRQNRDSEHNVFVLSTEYARDLTALPAMLQEDRIYVRRDSVLRFVWEKIEEWQWKRQQGAMSRLLETYNYDRAPEAAMNRIVDLATDGMILHELGEGQAGILLGEDWQELLMAVQNTRAERLARAVRDHLADCLTLLPQLVDQKSLAGLHFYRANFEGFRKQLWPGFLHAYDVCIKTGDRGVLLSQLQRGREHWLATGRSMLALLSRQNEPLAAHLEAMEKEIRLESD